MEIIILAGGFGTRLRSSIGEQPKCLADINGKPFLYYLHQYLIANGSTRLVHSLGYKADVVIEYLNNNEFNNIEVDYVVEDTPLGTGGGIQLALSKCKTENVIVVNGDTFFDVNLNKLIEFHTSNNAGISIALKEMFNFNRYGTVQVENDLVKKFEEKRDCDHGLINGGIYVINKVKFASKKFPTIFSLEQEGFPEFLKSNEIFGKLFSNYFIDIGIPEDYDTAKNYFNTSK